jgi:hypothetical protein
VARRKLDCKTPLSLPARPPDVTGVFGAHVVAIEGATGAVVGATVGRRSRNNPGPTQFDGSYAIERLPAGRSYQVYAATESGRPGVLRRAASSNCVTGTRSHRSRSIEDYFP